MTALDEIFVADTAGVPRIMTYSRTASGNAPPLRSISGPATGLNAPSEIALDLPNNEVITVDVTSETVAAHGRTASGNAAPIRTIQGPATGLDLPIGLALTPKLAMLATVNNVEFVTGQTIRQTLGIDNPGLPGTLDLYVGNLWPNGTLQFFVAGGAGVAFGSLANLGSFAPIAAGVSLATPFSVVVRDFFVHQWSGAELEGTFVLFILALRGGALSDGVVEPDEILGFASAFYTFADVKP